MDGRKGVDFFLRSSEHEVRGTHAYVRVEKIVWLGSSDPPESRRIRQLDNESEGEV